METVKTHKVKNRSAGVVVYSIPEANIRREFAPGETKNLTYKELEALSYQPGGRELMTDFLQLVEEEVTSSLNINRELEYDMSEKDIIDLIQNKSLEHFLDALDFAPQGVIDLIKSFSISLPMNDYEKREALKAKTGFDVTTALANLAQEQLEAKSENSAAAAPKRRVAPASQSQRRVQEPKTEIKVPKYKVVQ